MRDTAIEVKLTYEALVYIGAALFFGIAFLAIVLAPARSHPYQFDRRQSFHTIVLVPARSRPYQSDRRQSFRDYDVSCEVYSDESHRGCAFVVAVMIVVILGFVTSCD